MDYLASGQASLDMLGIVKLTLETHLETRQAGLSRMPSHRLLLAHGIFLLLAILGPSSQNQPSLCNFQVKAAKQRNKGHLKKQMSLITLNLKHCLRLKAQWANFSGCAKTHIHIASLLPPWIPEVPLSSLKLNAWGWIWSILMPVCHYYATFCSPLRVEGACSAMLLLHWLSGCLLKCQEPKPVVHSTESSIISGTAAQARVLAHGFK